MSNAETHTAWMYVHCTCTIMYIAFGNCNLRPLSWFSFSIILAANIIICEKRVGAETFPLYTSTFIVFIIKQTRRKYVEEPKMRIYTKECMCKVKIKNSEDFGA
jgi:hypothetical protein